MPSNKIHPFIQRKDSITNVAFNNLKMLDVKYSVKNELSKSISKSKMDSFYTGIKDIDSKVRSYKDLVHNLPIYSDSGKGD
jgi:hypothetical protein